MHNNIDGIGKNLWVRSLATRTAVNKSRQIIFGHPRKSASNMLGMIKILAHDFLIIVMTVTSGRFIPRFLRPSWQWPFQLSALVMPRPRIAIHCLQLPIPLGLGCAGSWPEADRHRR